MEIGDPARVLLVDASQLITEGLRISLQRTRRFRVVGVAHTSAEALRCLRGLLVDLVITDLCVPGGGPLRTVRDVREHRPTARTAVVSEMDSPEWAKAALEEGASAYLLKTTPLRELLPAFAEVLTGTDTLLDPRLGGLVSPPAELPPHTGLPQLSAREFDVLAEMLKGLDNTSIGRHLFISTDTVKTHVKAILRKLGARDRAQVVAMVLSGRVPH
ncbi:response regulator [Kutzneria viridogrisea]|uniref:DNA-binding NarL/FixJ family response regulator n=1 Tax=Kutzneria viridogrisea TaxID=47990 RepID=A0ABR6BGM2_9PSEU|nr:DNA-binding NarL/FixJ family response regulator [Kutzneria viridogrisea]